VTNYCENRLTINGSPADIEAFARDSLSLRDGLHELDFGKILPMPPVLKGLYRSVVSKLGGKFPNQLSSGWVAMEALARKPTQPPHSITQPQSVLNHAQVKELGILTYDDLELWLRANDPASLELGRKCLAAFDACGCHFQDDWMFGKWGCDPDRVQYSEADLSDIRYQATFVSPDGAPEGIIREIARRHPGLTSRFAALEEGYDYTFVLTANDGEIREERPSVTDAFIDEIEGARAVERRINNERSYYEESAVLKSRPLRHVRHWISEARLKRALADYPVYSPPHRGIEWTMPRQDARENFEFFLAQRTNRVNALKGLMARFGVAVDFTDATKTALDRWIATYGAFLYVSETGLSFWTHNPEWEGARLGFGVILDLAIFIGEFAIRESPGLKWEMDTRGEPGRTRSDDGFQRPAITATTPILGLPRDVIEKTFSVCHSLCEASYMWKGSRYHYGSRLLARHFVTKTLRHIYLCARDDFATANSEWIQDSRTQIRGWP
jgi:hypothetical protein